MWQVSIVAPNLLSLLDSLSLRGDSNLLHTRTLVTPVEVMALALGGREIRTGRADFRIMAQGPKVESDEPGQ